VITTSDRGQPPIGDLGQRVVDGFNVVHEPRCVAAAYPDPVPTSSALSVRLSLAASVVTVRFCVARYSVRSQSAACHPRTFQSRLPRTARAGLSHRIEQAAIAVAASRELTLDHAVAKTGGIGHWSRLVERPVSKPDQKPFARVLRTGASGASSRKSKIEPGPNSIDFNACS
jgi:hypothetical protein